MVEEQGRFAVELQPVGDEPAEAGVEGDEGEVAGGLGDCAVTMAESAASRMRAQRVVYFIAVTPPSAAQPIR